MSNLPNAIRDLPAFMERLMGNHAGVDDEEEEDDDDDDDDSDEADPSHEDGLRCRPQLLPLANQLPVHHCAEHKI